MHFATLILSTTGLVSVHDNIKVEKHTPETNRKADKTQTKTTQEQRNTHTPNPEKDTENTQHTKP